MPNKSNNAIVVLLVFIMLAEAVVFFFLLNSQANSFDKKLDVRFAALSEELKQEQDKPAPTLEPVLEPAPEPSPEPTPEPTPTPESPLYIVNEAPAYQASNGTRYYYEYSAERSGNSESFAMGGVKYTNGMVFKSYMIVPIWSVYNLGGNYSNLEFVVGHVDKTNTYNARLEFYLDGVLKKELYLRPDMLPLSDSIDLAGAEQLKLLMVLDGYGASYALGDPVLTR
ncbi:MAG: NPCBM/NEW2 domain-containing protein [Clostridiales bacterium]|jgi:hypothetical protein|nr:NPCBM/NEW2 domain-containing protein [Clostridiales bacterium]